MRLFRKSRKATGETPAQEISFSQLDITETFDDDGRLGPEEWIETIPLNRTVPDPSAVGLPALGAADDDVYEVAARLSVVRESIAEGDGVYCPICHIANTQTARLRTPCPQCGRELLSFGWS